MLILCRGGKLFSSKWVGIRWCAADRGPTTFLLEGSNTSNRQLDFPDPFSNNCFFFFSFFFFGLLAKVAGPLRNPTDAGVNSKLTQGRGWTAHTNNVEDPGIKLLKESGKNDPTTDLSHSSQLLLLLLLMLLFVPLDAVYIKN